MRTVTPLTTKHFRKIYKWLCKEDEYTHGYRN